MLDIEQLRERIVVNGRLAAGFLTADLPGVGGVIKQGPEDFQVTEIPLYAPSGSGTHTYFGLKKRGIDTNAAIRQVARVIGARAKDFGTAGLKDAQAVTEQAASIEHLSDAQVKALESLDTGSVRVTWVSRHTNKLKTGHLAGNRFRIRLREFTVGPEEAADRARAILKVLSERGAPNFYGPQRFGNRGDNWLLGLHELRGDASAFLDVLLGGPADSDPPKQREARELYEAGELEAARSAWPGGFRNERAALSVLIRSPQERMRAAGAVDRFLKTFCINALQSAVFNGVVDRRLAELDRVDIGDLAVKTAGSGCFVVQADDIDRERARAKSFEISATAPMVGSRTEPASGHPGEIENGILENFGLGPELFAGRGKKFRGERRAVRFPLAGATARADCDEAGAYLELEFAAPPGSYATCVTREIMK